MILALLALLQGPLPTVGDTIWIERAVELPAGAEVRAGAWSAENDLALLGRPLIRREGGRAIVSYPAVAWSAGARMILVPGPVVIRSDGTTDSLPSEPRSVTVASVLPPGQQAEQIPIQPQAGLVAERITSPWPLLVALLVAARLFAPVAWWWLRRGPALPPATPVPAEVVAPLGEWSEAGEGRAVAAAIAREMRSSLLAGLRGMPPGIVSDRLLRIVVEQRPAWPAEDLAALLRALDAAQFGEPSPVDIHRLAERAASLRRRLEGAA
jgi:hypothetical protein